MDGIKKASFLCGHFEGINFIYAIKSNNSEWHYFDELDSVSSQHGLLSSTLEDKISRLNGVKSIDVKLSQDRVNKYYDEESGKFNFNGKNLNTYMTMAGLNVSSDKKCKRKDSNTTDQLVFMSGETNPIAFLNSFEKCDDVKLEKDKMFKIRNFVEENHRAEFSNLYFNSNWSTMRLTFIKKYSLIFSENKRREMNIDFNKETSLRSFMHKKLDSMEKFTTLPLVNQIEITLADMPSNISNLFLMKEKMNCSKEEILEFCDTIQELVQTMKDDSTEQSNPTNNPQIPQQLEIFTYEPGIDSPALIPKQSARCVRKIVKPNIGETSKTQLTVPPTKRGRGRPNKKLPNIPESDDSSGYSFLNEMDTTSQSSSTVYSMQAYVSSSD